MHPSAPRRAALCAATVFALAGPALAAPPVPIPFHATVAITEQVAFPGTLPCIGIGTLQGSGAVPPVGSFTAISQDCINPVGPLDPTAGTFVFTSLPPGVTFDFGGGDRLTATYGGVVAPRDGEPHAVEGGFVITGGTGRFHQATGYGRVTGFETLDLVAGTGSGQVTFRGTLLLPRPAR